ncbi:MAG: hypothetical protein OEV00_14670 [Acidobacteriota bacterium]|nr:hypothetical protein [Acidobacteriota bacterium]MDH3786553.1 hypothetical protein [Acidobacteriota bacterium]
MSSISFRRICLLSLILLVSGIAMAQVPSLVNYQGRLTDNSPQQNPLTATLAMEFAIWDDPVGGVELWSEVWASVDVNNGIFSVLLGSNGTPLTPSVFVSGGSRYLEITVGGETLAPRQQMGSAAYAGLSSDSEGLGGLPSTLWQRRVVSSCAPNNFMRAVAADGTVTCEADDVGVGVENDPQVGALDPGDIPYWAGSTLLPSNIRQVFFDTGVGLGGGVDPAEDFHVYRADSDVARIYATGQSQGGGLFFAGQSPLYGGGFSYDGDNSPDITGGSDRITFFRRNNNVDTEVFSYGYANDDISFSGNLDAFTGATIGQYPGQSATLSAFYNNTAGNYTLLAGNDSTFLNVPNINGTMYFRTGNSNRMTVTSSEVDLTVSLDVAGTANIGWERVTAAGTTSATASSCLQGGTSWSCYQGTTTATCTAPRKVIGGGCNCSGLNDTICYGYPDSDTSYRCLNAEDSASQPFTAYAICARVGS